MKIDWFTMIAQIVNFLILLFLLKRFLYGPIVRAMNERERRIASMSEEAQERKKEAEREAESYRKKLSEIDSERQEALSQVKREAEALQRELLDKARYEVGQVQDGWYRDVRREQDSFLQDFRRRAGKGIYATIRRALKALANADLEDHLIGVFIERIRGLGQSEREAIAESVRKSGQAVALHSSFEIPPETRRRIVEAIHSQIEGGARVQFEVSPDLICGIELKAHGHKIAWGLESYLDGLEESLSEALAEGAGKKVGV